MDKQLIGTQTPLKNGPGTMEQKPGSTGVPLKEFVGTQAPISKTPSNLEPINAGTGDPMKQFLGSQAPLNHTPRHGWESYPTPMSERDIKQSK